MSIKTGMKTTNIKINNIPNTQANGNWIGNAVPITNLNKGMYLCNVNLAIASSGGAATMTYTIAVTTVLPWVDVNTNIIISTPNTGNLTTSAILPVYQSCSNVCIIDVDNTPIYLMIQCNVNVGNWGTTIAAPNQNNIISFTKIAPV